MTVRINTSDENATSAVFSPTDNWFAQADIPDDASGVFVEVQARADEDAPWVYVVGISSLTQPPLVQLAAMPYARFVMRGNRGGATVSAWSSQ